MIALDLRDIARALGGEVCGREVMAPGPGHSRNDRSLSMRLSATSPDGFLVHSFAGDDWRACRDYVRERLGLPLETAPRRAVERRGRPPQPRLALAIWRRRQPICEGTAAWRYLRQARGYGGPIPATLGFLPASGDHSPALIAAFGLPSEPDPGVLSIADVDVRAVQLVKLKPDGSGKSDAKPNKITIGRGALGVPIVLAAPNDALALAVCEGIEDALSVFAATGLGAWASGGATRLEALASTVPYYVETISIFGDNDEAGRQGAAQLALGLRGRGFEVILKFLRAESTP